MKTKARGMIAIDTMINTAVRGISIKKKYSILRANWFHLRDLKMAAGTPRIKLITFRGGGRVIMQEKSGLNLRFI